MDSFVRWSGRAESANELQDLERRIKRISKLSSRQRQQWDRVYVRPRLDCRAYRRISVLPLSFYHIRGLRTLWSCITEGLLQQIIPCNELSVIPPAIRMLSSLSSIDVSKNNLAELPHELGELPLEFLNVSYNKLTWLPASLIERHPQLRLNVMCNPWQHTGEPHLRARISPSSLFDLCCTALSANEDLFQSVATAPSYAALVPPHVRDYLLGETADNGRKSCSQCGKVFYGEALIERSCQRILRSLYV